MSEERPFLTVGMAACRNFEQVKWTIQMLRMLHPEVQDEIEILICDNTPGDPEGQAMKKWIAGWVYKNGRYIEAGRVQGTAFPREQVFRQARGEWVICIDSHVTLPLGTLRRFIDWARQQGETRDLYQGPMMLDDLQERGMATDMQPTWGAGMWGQWHTDPRGVDVDGEPFEILMHGLGLFACRREAWQHFNPRFVGFGGEEGYIHEKFRAAGAKCWCLPFLRWWHSFREDSLPKPYVNETKLQIRNYLIGFNEIGKPWDEILQEFAGKITREETLDLQMEFADSDEATKRLEILSRRVS